MIFYMPYSPYSLLGMLLLNKWRTQAQMRITRCRYVWKHMRIAATSGKHHWWWWCEEQVRLIQTQVQTIVNNQGQSPEGSDNSLNVFVNVNAIYLLILITLKCFPSQFPSFFSTVITKHNRNISQFFLYFTQWVQGEPTKKITQEAWISGGLPACSCQPGVLSFLPSLSSSSSQINVCLCFHAASRSSRDNYLATGLIAVLSRDAHPVAKLILVRSGDDCPVITILPGDSVSHTHLNDVLIGRTLYEMMYGEGKAILFI